MGSRSANLETPEAPRRAFPETLWVADVVRPHGVHGEVSLAIHSDVAERFEAGSRLLVTGPARPVESVRIASFRPHRRGGLARFEGFETRDQAEALRGCRLEVERHRSPAAPEGSYYYWQLVGCRCHDAEGGELGEVVDLAEDGGGLLLRVAGGDGELLVPFVEAYLERVDVAGGEIVLRLPAGFVETCTSAS